MFSVPEEDIAILDDEFNFSLLQTEKPLKAKKRQASCGNEDKPGNTVTPKKQLSNTPSSPQPKRFTFKKAPNVSSFSSSLSKEKNKDDFFTNDEDDDLLSKVEIPATAKPESKLQKHKRSTLDDNHSFELETREINTKYRFTIAKNKIYATPQPNNSSDKGSSNLLKSAGQVERSKQIVVEKSNDAPLRKFPGPAGNLPPLDNYTDINKLQSPKICKEKKTITPQKPYTPLQHITNSQESEIHNEVWTEIYKFVNINFSGKELYSISDVLARASHKTLSKHKAPLLCGIIKSFALIGSSGRLVLQDSTGEINGAVHSDILDEYQNSLQRGSGIVLKDVSVFSPTTKKHYLNITPSNIAVLLEGNLKDEQLTQFTQISNTTIILDESEGGRKF